MDDCTSLSSVPAPLRIHEINNSDISYISNNNQINFKLKNENMNNF